MKVWIFVTLLCVILDGVFVPIYGWGKTGHRVVGELAARNIRTSTKKKIARLLQGQSLALVSNYADEVRSDSAYKVYDSWHYANYPLDKSYTDQPPLASMDIIQALHRCIQKLKERTTPNSEKVFYLKYLVHLMGDLHQPLHLGRQEDLGGNKIDITWFGRKTNAHALWDNDMIDSYQMSYSELTSNLPVLSKAGRKHIQQGTVLDWAQETHVLARSVYDSVHENDALGYVYMYRHFDTAQRQLQKAGLRLARMLDELFL